MALPPVCLNHSGMLKSVDTLERNQVHIFDKLDRIGARINVILATVVIALIGVIATLLITLAKTR